jgi:hypothetical protein
MKKLNRIKKALLTPKVLAWGVFAFFLIKGLMWLLLLFLGYYFVI